MYIRRLWRSVVILGFASSCALAEFVPGRLYVAADLDWCDTPDLRLDGGIIEFDPLTGDWSVFARLPGELCSRLGGLTFSPDNTRLRASAFNQNSILEIDGDGNVSVALGPEDGISSPLGGNNIAYGPNGDFFVANSFRIMRFPAESGPGQVFAEGIDGFGAISVAPDGTVYFGPAGSDRRQIFRFTPEGDGSIFDTLPIGQRLSSLAVDGAGNVYAASSGGTYRYDTQDATTRTQLNAISGNLSIASLALSADQRTLFQASHNLFRSIDTITGETTPLGFIEIDPDTFFGAGYGMAYFVPEPSGLVAILFLCIATSRRLRRHAPTIRSLCE